MSVSSEVTVWCDHGRDNPDEFCGAWEQGSTGETALSLRSNLTRKGWATGMVGGRDYCPRHNPSKLVELEKWMPKE